LSSGGAGGGAGAGFVSSSAHDKSKSTHSIGIAAAMSFIDLKKDGFILKDVNWKNHDVKIAGVATLINR
jgi:hypothetical protein